MRTRGGIDRRGSGRGSRSTPPHLPAHTETNIVVPVVRIVPVAVGYAGVPQIVIPEPAPQFRSNSFSGTRIPRKVVPAASRCPREPRGQSTPELLDPHHPTRSCTCSTIAIKAQGAKAPWTPKSKRKGKKRQAIKASPCTHGNQYRRTRHQDCSCRGGKRGRAPNSCSRTRPAGL
jgi:hypothetical protein